MFFFEGVGLCVSICVLCDPGSRISTQEFILGHWEMVKEFLRRSYSTTEIGQNSDISHCPLVLSYGYRLVPWMRPKHLTFDGVFFRFLPDGRDMFRSATLTSPRTWLIEASRSVEWKQPVSPSVCDMRQSLEPRALISYPVALELIGSR